MYGVVKGRLLYVSGRILRVTKRDPGEVWWNVTFGLTNRILYKYGFNISTCLYRMLQTDVPIHIRPVSSQV